VVGIMAPMRADEYTAAKLKRSVVCRKLAARLNMSMRTNGEASSKSSLNNRIAIYVDTITKFHRTTVFFLVYQNTVIYINMGAKS